MAASIELGTVLSGQDIIDFDEYLKNPTCTAKGLQLFKEAEELSNSWK